MKQCCRIPAMTCALALCVFSAGCGSQSAPVKLLVVTPHAGLTPAPLPAFTAPCLVLPQHGTGSRLTFAGPCTLTQTARVQCIHQLDDFYAYIHRPLRHGWRLDVTINIEHYRGPGTYPRLAQFYMEVSKGTSLDAWGQDFASATVRTRERSVTFTRFTAPGYAGTIKVRPEVIAGTLACA